MARAWVRGARFRRRGCGICRSPEEEEEEEEERKEKEERGEEGGGIWSGYTM